jgi:hypothetical protein
MVGELYPYQMEGYKRIALYLTIKQKGLCHLCNQQIGKLSPIVKKHGKPPRYYHVRCAKRIHLL